MATTQEERIARAIAPLRVRAGATVNLEKDFDPSDKAEFVTKQQGTELLKLGVSLLTDYQRRLAAEQTWGVLVCLQALDAGGKDGTIRHVMSGVNPQGVSVHGFKVPSVEELDHDFLWRYACKLPSRGEITIFNRSHYEEVLVVRVHPELLDRQRLPGRARDSKVFDRRYRAINDWERFLDENGIKVVKILLNLSKEEQRRRFLKRLDRPERNWKFSSNDVRERAYWDAYQKAFSEMLSHTSTDWAPWYVVPADRKWFARICTSAILAHTMISLDPHYPAVPADEQAALADARQALVAEAPRGAVADPWRAGHEQGDSAPNGTTSAEHGARRKKQHKKRSQRDRAAHSTITPPSVTDGNG